MAQGNVKMTDGGEFDVTRRAILATNLEEGDRVVSVLPVTGQNQLVLATEGGYLLKIDLSEVSMQKRNARGIAGIRLTKGDAVETAWIFMKSEAPTVTFHEERIDLGSLRTAKRGTRGSRHGKD